MPLTRTIPGNIDLLALHRSHSQRYPYLLQSLAQGNTQARFDILFAFPGETLRLHADEPTSAGDFLQQLDEHWQQQKIPDTSNAELPFRGGWFLYLAYELAAQIEPVLSLPAANDGLPVAMATRVPAAVIVDHLRGHSLLLAEPGTQGLLEKMAQDVAELSEAGHALSGSNAETGRDAQICVSASEDDAAHFIRGVQRIKRYIVDGDVFQVNLSRAWRAQLQAGITDTVLYEALCARNPACFAGLALLDDAAIISSSPERLLRVTDGLLETRPIAGTRPRAQDHGLDHELQNELLSHPKERAEHIMLIDLERNDLGRVCVPGSVEVDELMVLESYAHVHHIVSNVRGRLQKDISPGQIIRALFPGGTITGCPKVRCMQIIAEQEQAARGAYTGSMGYLNHNGDMDLNILIRTMVRRGRQISLRAGAGIVADSQAENELQETRAKAKGLLLALGATGIGPVTDSGD